jgi:hypothetical protein
VSDKQIQLTGAVDPEKAHVLVTGDCGHMYPVPLARLEDGADFTCPTCGHVDRLDEEALRAAKEELAQMRAKGPLHELGQLVSDFFERSEGRKKKK